MELTLADAKEIAALSHDLDEAMGRLNLVAQKFTEKGYTVRVHGWTSPGTFGNVRCQGNSTVSIEEPQ